MVKTKLEQRLIDALEAEASARDIDIVDVELTGATKAPCVRVRLEKADGSALSLDDVCAQNCWVSAVVEDIDPVAGRYTLEVSSPGMARPLRRPRDFARFVGQTAQIGFIQTQGPDGRSRLTGLIQSANEDCVTIAPKDGEPLAVPFEAIKKATLKPSYDFGRAREGK
ncbi:protein of unknown function DUF150 [Coriobacterium glomerans PW2]|uniref:Ribosome maturation factor RimP n=1 Tax=Coriobacterium glomerans (strain ATCC 49209 / DSM 20642 / JCM 10262 / PW2) TaxID=700015 RepID=F2N9Q0_CORGP|nr:ribosome maturation factor RimP [Coriobacterium glomerans]AEB07153.1 protein of unknown function DUF150 [Coriobacterium glomerans PW2]